MCRGEELEQHFKSVAKLLPPPEQEALGGVDEGLQRSDACSLCERADGAGLEQRRGKRPCGEEEEAGEDEEEKEEEGGGGEEEQEEEGWERGSFGRTQDVRRERETLGEQEQQRGTGGGGRPGVAREQAQRRDATQGVRPRDAREEPQRGGGRKEARQQGGSAV